MQGDRSRGKGPGENDSQEWAESDWDPDERPARGHAGDSPPGVRDQYRGGVEIRSDIANVVDDPLYDAQPGERPGQSDPERRGPGLSIGQKILLWIGFALVSAVSFGAGLIVGASGGINAPFLGMRSEETLSPEGFDALGPPLDPEGVIQFGDRGIVPSRIEDGGAVSQVEKSGADRTKAPQGAITKETTRPAKVVTAAPAKPKEAREAVRKPAKKPAPKVVAASEPEPKATSEPAPEPEAAPSEMTFYETSTGEKDMPGLSGRDEAMEDAEAPPDVAPEPEPAVPAGADVLAQRRAEQAENVLPPPDARGEAEETPTGADLLARRRSAGTESSPAATPGIRDDIYTVQVTTLADEREAKRLAARLKAKGFDVRIVPLSRSGLGTLYRLRVGRYPTEAAARRDLNRLVSEPGAHPYIRME